jgi:hypothetical protein
MRFWNLLLDPLMWSGSIEVLRISVKHSVNPFNSPKSILRCHLPDQSDGFCGYLRLMRSGLRPALPDKAKELTMPT